MTGVFRLLLPLLLATALALPIARPSGADPTVFAAASLKDGLDAVITAWAAETGNTATVSYGGSGTLARQIEQGAPVDLFVSANVQWMDHLEQNGLIDAATRIDLLGNRIVLVAPADQPRDMAVEPGFDLAAALGDGRLALASVDAVPAGIYAKAALQSLDAWEDVAGRLAQAENVRAALAYVARGEAPLGIVYATDAIVEPRVTVVGVFPEASHPPIVYPAALTADAGDPMAASLLEFLHSPRAAMIFGQFGFAVPD